MRDAGMRRRSALDVSHAEGCAGSPELTSACEIVEGSGVGSHFDPTLTHTIHQLADVAMGVTFAPGLYLREAGGWYVAELQRAADGEVINLHLTSGPWASSLHARLQQLSTFPHSLRPAPCDPASLPPHGDDPATVNDWARRWARQLFDGADQRRAVAGYLAAMWGGPPVPGEGHGAEAWTRGWVAGCTARILGFKAISLALQQQEYPPQPGVPPFWRVMNLFTGRPIPSLTDIPTRAGAERLAREAGLLGV